MSDGGLQLTKHNLHVYLLEQLKLSNRDKVKGQSISAFIVPGVCINSGLHVMSYISQGNTGMSPSAVLSIETNDILKHKFNTNN